MSISTSEDGGRTKAALAAAAREEGFDVVGVARPDSVPLAAGRLAEFLAAGRHGDMDWLEATADRRERPRALWPEVRSVVMLGLDYAPDRDPLADTRQPRRGAVSVYARNEDYHEAIKKRLKRVARTFAARAGADVKVFVDTAPVMEKPLAEAAGIGWQGKHTNLVSRRFGSWLFLGAIFTDADLPEDAPEADHCGSCRACLDVCPTDAFPAPYQLDARRCISYLTIEHRGAIPRHLRAAIGNRIFGCDDCLAVCPWNKFAASGRAAKLAARADIGTMPLEDLSRLDDASFRELFRKTPVKRTGRDRFARNVMIAIGNSADPALAPAARARLRDASPLVRGAAVWALARLEPPSAFRRLAATHLPDEPDKEVCGEWRAELGDGAGSSS